MKIKSIEVNTTDIDYKMLKLLEEDCKPEILAIYPSELRKFIRWDENGAGRIDEYYAQKVTIVFKIP